MEEKQQQAKKPRAPKKAKAAVAVEETTATVQEQVGEDAAKKPVKKPVKQAAPKRTAKAKKTAENTAQEPQKADVQAEAQAQKKPLKKAAKKQQKPQPESKDEQVQEIAVEQAANEAEDAPKTESVPSKKTAKKGGRGKTNAKSAAEQGAESVAETPVAVPVQAPVEEVAQPPKQSVENRAETPKKAAKKSAKKQEKPAEQTQETASVPTMTRAEKKDAIMVIVRELLQAPCKWADLLDGVAKVYKDKYPSKENERDSDVKGRIGSVIDLMKKEGEVVVENGVARLIIATAQETQETQNEPPVSATNEQTPPVSTQETATEVAAVAVQETTAVTVQETSAPAPVYDMSSLFERKKPTKQERKQEEPKQEVKVKVATIAAQREEEQTQTGAQENEPLPVPVEQKTEQKTERKAEKRVQGARRTDVPKRVANGRLPVGEKRDPLKELFLRKLRSLGGDYFEYYSVYLLERYSRRNGRRLEGLRISGGENDGGIDGEIELTDRLGFRETIYIQAKNWAPTDEKWMVGETLLQQFIGAVTYRQATEGKQHCRGMFITTSCFTAGAKAMLEKLSDKFVGYDGDELYETAKECEFGLMKGANGEWKIDEELLSGERALFYLL